MLKNFENWLLQNNYKPTTAADYMAELKDFAETNSLRLLISLKIFPLFCRNMKLPVKNPVMANVRILQFVKL